MVKLTLNMSLEIFFFISAECVFGNFFFYIRRICLWNFFFFIYIRPRLRFSKFNKKIFFLVFCHFENIFIAMYNMYRFFIHAKNYKHVFEKSHCTRLLVESRTVGVDKIGVARPTLNSTHHLM